MFKNLFDLGYKRTKLQAFGFWLVYSLLIVIIGAFANGLVTCFLYPDAKTVQDGYQAGLKVGRVLIPILAVVMSSALSISVIVSKKLKDAGAVILAIFAILLTPFLGAFIGTIFTAILTTYDNKNI